MARRLWHLLVMSAGLAVGLGVAPVEAQHPTRFEITPMGGYMWGGSFDTDGLDPIPPGSLDLNDGFGWGAVLSFIAQPLTAVEIMYLRQDSDVSFDPNTGATRDLGGFATNYLHLGGRHEFLTSSGLRPFVSGSLGITIFDPKAEEVDNSTRFSFSLGLGGLYMFGPTQRLGVRTDLRVWVTPVPSGSYTTWCDFYGCFAAEGTDWVSQGQITGGIVFAF